MTARKSEDACGSAWPSDPIRRRLLAMADLEYVLEWLRQTEAPDNIIGLQERAADLIAGREADRG